MPKVQRQRHCDSCHASESEIMFHGHRVFDGIGVCAQACGCVPQHLSLQEHQAAVSRWRVMDAIDAHRHAGKQPDSSRLDMTTL